MASWTTATKSSVTSEPTSTNSTGAEPRSRLCGSEFNAASIVRITGDVERILQQVLQRRLSDDPQRRHDACRHQCDQHPPGHVAAIPVRDCHPDSQPLPRQKPFDTHHYPSLLAVAVLVR